MKKIIVLIFLFLPLVQWACGWNRNAGLFVQSVYPDATFQLKKIKITKKWNEQALSKVGEAFQHRRLSMAIIKKDKQNLGYLVIDSAQGKTDDFVIAIIFDWENKIRSVEVLKDSSEHGLKLKQMNFLKQFYGRSLDSSYHIGMDIDGISGSTYSVQGLSRAIWRISLILPELTDLLK